MSLLYGQKVVLQFGDTSNNSLVHLWNSLVHQTSLFSSEDEDFTPSALLECQVRGEPIPRCVLFTEKQGGCELVETAEVVSRSTAPGWQRYSFTKFHPSSKVELSSISIDRNMDGGETSMFYRGMEHANSADLADVALEPIRLMVERCDELGGFISIHDALGYWGGLGSTILQEARDQFRPGQVDTFAFCSLINVAPVVEGHDQVLDTALNWHHLCSQSERFIPLFALQGDSSPQLPSQAHLIDAACMLETYYTGLLYPMMRDRLGSIPKGTLYTGFGFGPADRSPANITSLLDFSRLPPAYQPAFEVIRREGEQDNRRNAIPIPLYRADIEHYSLCKVSSNLVLGLLSRSPGAALMKGQLLEPLLKDPRLRRKLANNEYEGEQILESLERISLE